LRRLRPSIGRLDQNCPSGAEEVATEPETLFVVVKKRLNREVPGEGRLIPAKSLGRSLGTKLTKNANVLSQLVGGRKHRLRSVPSLFPFVKTTIGLRPVELAGGILEPFCGRGASLQALEEPV
jgi:hypothetical protein